MPIRCVRVVCQLFSNWELGGDRNNECCLASNSGAQENLPHNGNFVKVVRCLNEGVEVAKKGNSTGD